MLTHRPRRPARGLSLVELLVGIAVGMFVVAAAAMLVSTQLNDNRRLLLETQVQQDLRAAADIITRDLRRDAYWPDSAKSFVWTADSATPPVNPLSKMQLTGTNEIEFWYLRQPSESGPFGFKKDGNVLKTRLGAGGWQELTDGNTLRITAFSITPQDGPQTPLPCPKLCSDGTNSCWPTLTVRELEVAITGEAVSDPSVKRTLRTVVRLRNDLVEFNMKDPTGAPLPQVCPG